MTNKPMLSVERELLERLTEKEVVIAERNALLQEMRDLATAIPVLMLAVPNPHDVASRDKHIESVNALLERCDAELSTSAEPKPRGEPVAICRLWNEGGSGERTSVEFIGEPCADGTLLYAEQPALVAVVLPERESFDIDDWAGSFCQEALQGGISQHVFERCIQTTIQRVLAEVARLNGVKP